MDEVCRGLAGEISFEESIRRQTNMHHTYVEALKQTDATCKALLKVDFATHGTLGDGTYLIAYAIALGQLVDTLGLNQC